MAPSAEGGLAKCVDDDDGAEFDVVNLALSAMYYVLHEYLSLDVLSNA